MIFCALVTLLSMVIAQQLDPTQHTALMEVYAALGCNETICPRFATSSNCTGPPTCIAGNIQRLDIVEKQLSGTISSSIGMLTALTRLALFGNQLKGTIPTQIRQLMALTYLSLHSNQLTNTLPIHIGQLPALKYLYLWSNQLTGSIPSLSSTIADCSLQLGGVATNCLDCLTAPPTCTCSPRTCPPTSMRSTTTVAPSSTSGMSTLQTTFEPDTTSADLSTIATTSGETTTTTTDVESTTLMPAAQMSDDNIVLIGGIVGGVVALLLIIGLIAFIMTRRKRQRNNSQSSNRNDVSMAPAQASSSNNYGKIIVHPTSNDYDESFLNKPPAIGQVYDDAGVLANNNYGIGRISNQNQTNYEHPSVLSH